LSGKPRDLRFAEASTVKRIEVGMQAALGLLQAAAIKDGAYTAESIAKTPARKLIH
jgi:hypothetical protein